jgi:uncharacterized protein YjeT (DUF2065 family)
MEKTKNYFIYTVCSIFTIIGTYLLIDSFMNPDFELSESAILKNRLVQINSILFFGGLGYVYYILKRNRNKINKSSLKTNIAILLGCLIFILNGLYLINYPEDFKKGNKLIKIIISYTTVIFFGISLIMAVYKLIQKKSKR